MKTELLDFVWDIISEETIKTLKMENISYTHYENIDALPQNGFCKDFFFRTKEDDIFCLTVIIENDVSKRQVELYTYIISVRKEDRVRESELYLDYRKYKEELETIRRFVNYSLKHLQLQIHIEKKVRLFFSTGHTLYVSNEVEERWEDIQNNKRL